MPQTTRCVLWRDPRAPHSFDPVSGWCRHGCGTRDDGRHQTPGGQVIDPGPTYYPHDLAKLATKLQEISHDQDNPPAQPLF